MVYCVGHRPIHNQKRKKKKKGGGGGGGGRGAMFSLYLRSYDSLTIFSPTHYFYQSRRYENNVVKCCRSYCEN